MLEAIVRILQKVRRRLADERGEVNVSMIAWMVISALVIFALQSQIAAMLTGAITFVRSTLGI